MPDFDQDDLQKSVATLEARLQKEEEPVEVAKQATGLLNKALDAILSLAGGKKALAKSEDDPPMDDDDKEDSEEKSMTMDEDRADDVDIVTALMELFGDHLDEHEEGDKAMALDGGANKSLLTRRNSGGVVVVHDYLHKSLQEQAAQGTRLKALEERMTPLSKALTVLAEELQAAKAAREVHGNAIAALTKGMMALLEHRETTAAEEPVRDSRYEQMAKSVRSMLGENGGQLVAYNKSRASAMILDGRLTQAQHRLWKITGRLPEGVSLAS